MREDRSEGERGNLADHSSSRLTPKRNISKHIRAGWRYRDALESLSHPCYVWRPRVTTLVCNSRLQVIGIGAEDEMGTKTKEEGK